MITFGRFAGGGLLAAALGCDGLDRGGVHGGVHGGVDDRVGGPDQLGFGSRLCGRLFGDRARFMLGHVWRLPQDEACAPQITRSNCDESRSATVAAGKGDARVGEALASLGGVTHLDRA